MRNHSSGVTAIVVSIVVVGFVFGVHMALAQTPAATTPQKPSSAQPAFKAMEKSAMGEATEVTLRGEVVDLSCYMQDPSKAQGPEHAKCVRAGFPVGYVSDGQLYLLLGKGQDPAKELIAGLVGVKTELTGKLYEQNGVKAIDPGEHPENRWLRARETHSQSRIIGSVSTWTGTSGWVSLHPTPAGFLPFSRRNRH